MRLIVACSVTTAGHAAGAGGGPQFGLDLRCIVSEFLRYGAWFFVLTGLTRAAEHRAVLSRFAHFAWIGAVVLLVAMPLFADAGSLVPSPSAFLASAGLLLALLGLLLLEQIHRNARKGGRYAFKYLVMGLGLVFAYDLFLFAGASCSAASNRRPGRLADWSLSRCTVPLFAIAARRNPQWSLNLFVSRHVVFYSTSALFVGVYLLLMAAGGYWVRLHGGAWGRVAQLVFVAAAAVVLLAVMGSGTLRRRLRRVPEPALLPQQVRLSPRVAALRGRRSRYRSKAWTRARMPCVR